jgi:hypothetical protein
MFVGIMIEIGKRKKMQYKFSLTKAEQKKYEAWLDTLPKIDQGHFGAAGGGHWFRFTPTGLGTLVEAGRYDVPELDINLTDFSEW